MKIKLKFAFLTLLFCSPLASAQTEHVDCQMIYEAFAYAAQFYMGYCHKTDPMVRPFSNGVQADCPDPMDESDECITCGTIKTHTIRHLLVGKRLQCEWAREYSIRDFNGGGRRHRRPGG